MGAGGLKTLEPIDRVLERCRFRIDRSLDVNIADVMRLIEEIERTKRESRKLDLPMWHGLGNGD